MAWASTSRQSSASIARVIPTGASGFFPPASFALSPMCHPDRSVRALPDSHLLRVGRTRSGGTCCPARWQDFPVSIPAQTPSTASLPAPWSSHPRRVPQVSRCSRPGTWRYSSPNSFHPFVTCALVFRLCGFPQPWALTQRLIRSAYRKGLSIRKSPNVCP
jgi:hypothetical protein